MARAIGYKAWIQARRHAREHGIEFHEPWRRAFAAVVRDLGTADSQAAKLVRLDNSGSFVPGNVEWRTPKGWVIWDVDANLDGGREYVARVWKRKRDAAAARACLLQPYPPGHVWRKRLEVRKAGG